MKVLSANGKGQSGTTDKSLLCRVLQNVKRNFSTYFTRNQIPVIHYSSFHRLVQKTPSLEYPANLQWKLKRRILKIQMN